MICPNDATQMHQWGKVGGGMAEGDKYETWEVKECPQCHRLVKETYCCEALTLSQAHKLKKDMGVVYVEDDPYETNPG